VITKYLCAVSLERQSTWGFTYFLGLLGVKYESNFGTAMQVVTPVHRDL